MRRPTGITILGILYILGGIAGLIAAVVFGAMSAMMGSSNYFVVGIGALGGIFAIVFAGVAVLEFAIAGCLLSGKSWARKIVIVFVAIDLVLEFISIFGGNLFGIAMLIIDLFVLYYLYRPHVKKYFGEISNYKTCIYCNYLAEDTRDLHNHQLDCVKKKNYDLEKK